jgi:hypothetical protein
MSGTSKGRSKSIFVALAAGAVVLQLCVVGPAAAASVTLSWSYNYTVDVPCTSSVTKNCVSGFEYGTTPDGGTTLNKIGTVSNPTPASSGSTAVTTTFTQGPPYGSVIYYARTIGLDGNGNTLYSTVALATAVQIVPTAPTGLTVAIH